jgi:hypothetical protein
VMGVLQRPGSVAACACVVCGDALQTSAAMAATDAARELGMVLLVRRGLEARCA